MSQALSQIAEPETRLPAIRGGIPSAPARTLALTGYLHSNLEPIPGNFRRYALSAAHDPSPEQRALLVARRQEIDAGLAGCDEATIREQIGILRSSMAVAQAGEAAMHLAKRGFIMVLGRYPAWAVVEACMRFLDGRSGNKVYAPTAAEIADVCRTLISDDLHERARINAILDAEVYGAPSEAEREEVARRHQAFVEETAARARRHRNEPGVEPAGTASAERLMAAAELAERKAKREAEEAAAKAIPASPVVKRTVGNPG